MYHASRRHCDAQRQLGRRAFVEKAPVTRNTQAEIFRAAKRTTGNLVFLKKKCKSGLVTSKFRTKFFNMTKTKKALDEVIELDELNEINELNELFLQSL